MENKFDSLEPLTIEYCLTEMMNANSDDERNFWEKHLEYMIEFEKEARKRIIK